MRGRELQAMHLVVASSWHLILSVLGSHRSRLCGLMSAAPSAALWDVEPRG